MKLEQEFYEKSDVLLQNMNKGETVYINTDKQDVLQNIKLLKFI